MATHKIWVVFLVKSAARFPRAKIFLAYIGSGTIVPAFNPGERSRKGNALFARNRLTIPYNSPIISQYPALEQSKASRSYIASAVAIGHETPWMQGFRRTDGKAGENMDKPTPLFQPADIARGPPTQKICLRLAIRFVFSIGRLKDALLHTTADFFLSWKGVVNGGNAGRPFRFAGNPFFYQVQNTDRQA